MVVAGEVLGVSLRGLSKAVNSLSDSCMAASLLCISIALLLLFALWLPCSDWWSLFARSVYCL